MITFQCPICRGAVAFATMPKTIDREAERAYLNLGPVAQEDLECTAKMLVYGMGLTPDMAARVFRLVCEDVKED